MLKVTQEISHLGQFEPWSGAVETARLIVGAGKGERFIQEIEAMYPDGLSDVELNDLLWHDSEWCLNLVGLSWEDDDEDDESDEEDGDTEDEDSEDEETSSEDEDEQRDI